MYRKKRRLSQETIVDTNAEALTESLAKIYQAESPMNRTLNKVESDMQTRIDLLHKSANMQTQQLELAAVTASCAAATAANTEAIRYLTLIN